MSPMKCFKIFGMKENKYVQTGAEEQTRSSLFAALPKQTPMNKCI